MAEERRLTLIDNTKERLYWPEDYEGDKITLENTESLASGVIVRYKINTEPLVYAKTLYPIVSAAEDNNMDYKVIFEGVSAEDAQMIRSVNEEHLISLFTNAKIFRNLEKYLNDPDEIKEFFLGAGYSSAENSPLIEYSMKYGRGIKDLSGMLAGGNSEFNHSKYFHISHNQTGNNTYKTEINVRHVPEGEFEKGTFYYNIGHYNFLQYLSDDTVLDEEMIEGRNYNYDPETKSFSFTLPYEERQKSSWEKLKSFIVSSRVKGKLKKNRRITDKIQESILKKTQDHSNLRRTTYEELLKHDVESAHHTNRTSYWLAPFLRMIGASEEDIFHATIGMPNHDIGKILVPSQILRKSGKLDDDEFTIIRVPHAALGHYLLRIEKGLVAQAADLAQFHQERANGFDGGGYYQGITWEQTPIIGSASQLIDVAEALLNRRVYKDAMPLEKVIEIIKNDIEKGVFQEDLGLVFVEEFLPLIGDLNLYGNTFKFNDTLLGIKELDLRNYEEYKRIALKNQSRLARDMQDFVLGKNNKFSLKRKSGDLKNYLRNHRIEPLNNDIVFDNISKAIGNTYNKLNSSEFILHLLDVTPPLLRVNTIVERKDGTNSSMEDILNDISRGANRFDVI